MNRNALIFVVASMLVLLGWPTLMEKLGLLHPVAEAPAPTASPAPTPVSGSDRSSAAVAATASTAPLISLKAAPEKTVAVETDTFHAVLSTWGARFTHLRLKGIVHHEAGKAEELDLVPSLDQPRFAAVELGGQDLGAVAWSLLTPQPIFHNGEQVLRFALRLSNGLELLKSFRFPAHGHRLAVDLQLTNRSPQLVNAGSLALLWGPNLGGEDGQVMGRFPMTAVVQLADRVEREKASREAAVLGYSRPRWIALKSHYFVVGSFPSAGAWTKGEVRNRGGEKLETALVAESLSLQPGQVLTWTADVYAGPQEYSALKALGKEIKIGERDLNFQAVVQFQFYRIFDWLNPLSVGLLGLLKWFYAMTGNWGMAIILLTLLVRGLLFWPSLKSMVSMRRMQTKMAAMQPRLDTLKKIYKDDPAKLNAETMKLYKEFGVNPLGGCLPMLVQIPVFFALYGTLSVAFELRGAPFWWKWTDLTAGDPTHLFPLAMGVSMFLQQKLTPASATMSEEQVQIQKMMLWIMPILFTGMAIFMAWPVGLLLYWTASNVFSIMQQLVVNKVVD
jgi:YidC/Oxa1 family membrane protein insertase